MFEKICIRQNDKTFATDIGFVAENLLYYKQVILIAGQKTLPILLNNCNVEILIELLTRKLLRICVCESVLGVASYPQGDGSKIYGVTNILSDSLKAEQMFFDSLYNATGRNGYSRRVVQRLMPFIERISYDNNIGEIVREDLGEKNYIKTAIADIVNYYAPQISLNAREFDYDFELTGEVPFGGQGFAFALNLNLENINSQISNNPDGQLINLTSIILNVLETRGDFHLASTLNAEIATNEIHTALMRLKFKDIYEKTTQNKNDLFQFNDFILSNGHAIRETINSGQKSFTDFIEILDKAEKFKSWLENVEENRDIIKEYYEAVTKDSWIDKLPPKSLRWSLFTGAGLALDIAFAGGIGTALGTALGFGDEFLLDKIAKKWKPNIFVEKKLKKFIK